MDLLLQIEKIINRINDFFGRGVSWLLVLMVLNVFIVVVLRYVFSFGEVWMQETYVWMHSIVFLLGAGYTLLNNGHVRIDLVYSNASRRYKALIDFIGTIVFAFPVLVFLFIKSLPFIERSGQFLKNQLRLEVYQVYFYSNQYYWFSACYLAFSF